MAAVGLRTYLELCRASNLPTVWTNALCAVILSGSTLLSIETLGAVAGLSLIYVAGMCLNDLIDLPEDRVRKPGRPLPSGRMTVARAAVFTALLFVSGLALLLWMSGLEAFVWGVVLCAVVVLYDWLHRLHAASVLLMAGCRGLVFVVASSAGTGVMTRAVVIAGLAQFLYVIVLSLISRWEKTALRRPIVPIPWLLAGISLVDGALLAVFAHPGWLVLGLAGAGLTRLAQHQVPGD